MVTHQILDRKTIPDWVGRPSLQCSFLVARSRKEIRKAERLAKKQRRNRPRNDRISRDQAAEGPGPHAGRRPKADVPQLSMGRKRKRANKETDAKKPSVSLRVCSI